MYVFMYLFIYFQKDGRQFRKRLQESIVPGESVLFFVSNYHSNFNVWGSNYFMFYHFSLHPQEMIQKSPTVQNLPLQNVKPHPPPPLPHRGFPDWSPIAIPHLGRRRRRSPSLNLPHRGEISAMLDAEIARPSLLPGPTCTNIAGKLTPCAGTA